MNTNQMMLVIFTLYPPKQGYYKTNHCSINQFLTNFALFSLCTGFWPRRCICKKVALGITQWLCRKQVVLTVMQIKRTLVNCSNFSLSYHTSQTLCHMQYFPYLTLLLFWRSLRFYHYIHYTVVVTDARAT